MINEFLKRSVFALGKQYFRWRLRLYWQLFESGSKLCKLSNDNSITKVPCNYMAEETGLVYQISLKGGTWTCIGET